MKKLITFLFLLNVAFAQDSWVNFKVQYDFYGPSESNFFMVKDTVNGDTVMFHAPSVSYEFLDTTIDLNSGNYLITLTDNFGDGWISSQPAWFKVQNICQGEIVNFNPLTQQFFTLDTLVNIWPCAPPVIGCMDVNALNYDSNATVGDNSCTYPPCQGLLTSNATQQCLSGGQVLLQYDWTLDNNASCEPVAFHYSTSFNGPYIYGLGSGSTNFAVYAGTPNMPPNWSVEHYGQVEFADGSMSDTILYTPYSCIEGCIDSTAVSYNPWANVDDGSCGGTTCDPATEYQITMSVTLDNWPQETGWTMVTNAGSNVEAQSGTYTYNDIGQTYTYDFCVSSTAGFEMILSDTYGDGMMGVNPQEAGEVVIYDCNGDTITYLSSGTWSDGANNVGVDLGGYPNGSVAYSTPQQGVACDGAVIVDGCTDPSYQEYNPLANNDDSTCVNLHMFGCIDSMSYNYDPAATQMEIVDLCNYTLTIKDDAADGWGNSYLGVMQGVNTWTFTMGPGSYSESFQLMLETDKPVKVYYFEVPNIQNPDPQQTAFQTFQNSFILENADGVILLEEGSNPFANNGQGALQGFKSPFWVTYEAIPYCGDYCEPFVYGCLDLTAVNYDSLVNADDGSCYYLPGCTSSAFLEYYTQGFVADYDDNSCQTAAIWGCTDSTMYNFDPVANISNGGCIPYVYGCMDPTAFNYDPLATADGACIAYIYGCTDPTMFNFSAVANTDNGSCLEYVYGCTDSLAINYNYDANTSNGSCIYPLLGCTDPTAENYNISANVSDSSCYYSAGCYVGDVYYIPNECFSWVIEVDELCCDAEWDNTCVSLYNYCVDGWSGPTDILELRNKLTTYPNPTAGILYVNKKVNLRVFNMLGDMIMYKEQANALDMSILPSGLYNILIEYKNIKTNKRIIKQ